MLRSAFRQNPFGMIENEQHEVELSQAARLVAQRARAAADRAHVTLTAVKWHRGHEVADLDNWWLTLASDKHAVTENFASDRLAAYGNQGSDSAIAEQVAGMVEALRRH